MSEGKRKPVEQVQFRLTPTALAVRYYISYTRLNWARSRIGTNLIQPMNVTKGAANG